MTAPTRPSTLYVWDSSGTHIVVPTSGHQTSGFVNDEVPGSGEVNGLWQCWGQELTWLDYWVSAMLASQTTWQLPGLSILTAGADAGQLFAPSDTDFSIALGASIAIEQVNIRVEAPPVGTVLQNCLVVYAATASGVTGFASFTMTLRIIHSDGTSTSFAAISSTTAAARNTFTIPLVGSTYTMVAGDGLLLNFTSGSGSGQGATLYQIGLQTLPV